MRDFKSSPSFSHHRKKSKAPLILSILAIGIAGGSFWLMSSEESVHDVITTDNNSQTITVPLTLPPQRSLQSSDIKQSNQTEPASEEKQSTPSTTWKQYTIASGDSLSKVFDKLNLSHKDMNALLTNKTSKKHFKVLNIGEIFEYSLSDSGQLALVRYDLSPTKTQHIHFTDHELIFKTTTRETHTRIVKTSATISSSLSLAGQEAGLSNKQTMNIANIFGWDIDFALDIRKGDHFNAVIEETMLSEDDTVIESNILAAQFTNHGKTFRAIRYTDPKGNTAYYTPDGKSLKRAFLRSPVKFARVSSRFNLKRKHPVLNKIRAHKGVDYAARSGTAIRAAGAGKIIHRGRKGGYGRTVVLKHGSQYSTLYAHMSNYKRGLKHGSKVRQGDIIGYVGQSGLATGPHLHYEFRVNGVHKDPLRVKLPQAKPIKKQYLNDFLKTSEPLLAKLELLDQNEQNQLLASNP